MRGDSGSLSSSVEVPGKVDDRGVGTGDDIDNSLLIFFLGDSNDDRIEEVRDWVFSVRDNPTSILLGLADRDCDFSILDNSMSTALGGSFDLAINDLERVFRRGGAPAGIVLCAANRGGSGAAFRIMPFSFASSCSLT